MTFLQYYGLIAAVPSAWVTEIRSSSFILEDFEFQCDSCVGKISQMIYSKLISDRYAFRKIADKWNSKFGYNIPLEVYLDSFQNLYKLVPSTKLRNFQFRFLYRIIFCGQMLHSWNLIDTPLCIFCQEDYETLEHLFYFCPITKRFWETFVAWFESRIALEVNISWESVVLCNHEIKLLNTLLIMAKQFIFSRRCLHRLPNIHIFREQAMQILDFERHNAIKTYTCKNFIKKWNIFF